MLTSRFVGPAAYPRALAPLFGRFFGGNNEENKPVETPGDIFAPSVKALKLALGALNELEPLQAHQLVSEEFEACYFPLFKSMETLGETVAKIYFNDRNTTKAKALFEKAIGQIKAAWGDDDERLAKSYALLGLANGLCKVPNGVNLPVVPPEAQEDSKLLRAWYRERDSFFYHYINPLYREANPNKEGRLLSLEAAYPKDLTALGTVAYGLLHSAKDEDSRETKYLINTLLQVEAALPSSINHEHALAIETLLNGESKYINFSHYIPPEQFKAKMSEAARSYEKVLTL